MNEAAYKQARSEFWSYNTWGAGIVCFWLTLMFLMMLGFSYSFFWSAATMIYLLMRKKVDEAELDEVFIEDDEPEPPLAPAEARGRDHADRRSTSLPVIQPPAAPPMPPPPPPPIHRRHRLRRRAAAAAAGRRLPFSPPPPPQPEPPKTTTSRRSLDD